MTIAAAADFVLIVVALELVFAAELPLQAAGPFIGCELSEEPLWTLLVRPRWGLAMDPTRKMLLLVTNRRPNIRAAPVPRLFIFRKAFPLINEKRNELLLALAV